MQYDLQTEIDSMWERACSRWGPVGRNQCWL